MTKKELRWLISPALILLMLVPLQILGCGGEPAPPPTAAKPAVPATRTYSWRIQSFQPPGNYAVTTVIPAFAKRVFEASNGRMDIKVFGAGEIVPMMEALDAVSKGVMEMAFGFGGFWAGKVGPVAEVETGLPYGIQRPEQNDTLFYDKGVLTLTREVYAKYGVYFLAPINAGTETLVSKVPLVKVDDFKGLTIMDPGSDGRFETLMGAKTKSLPASELYTALSTGVVDAVGWSGPAQMFGQLKLHEVAKYIWWPPFRMASTHIIVNSEKWKELPDDIKADIELSARVFSSQYRAWAYSEDLRWLKEGVEKHGVKVTGVPESQLKGYADQLWSLYAAEDPVVSKIISIQKDYFRELGLTQ